MGWVVTFHAKNLVGICLGPCFFRGVGLCVSVEADEGMGRLSDTSVFGKRVLQTSAAVKCLQCMMAAFCCCMRMRVALCLYPTRHAVLPTPSYLDANGSVQISRAEPITRLYSPILALSMFLGPILYWAASTSCRMLPFHAGLPVKRGVLRELHSRPDPTSLVRGHMLAV